MKSMGWIKKTLIELESSELLLSDRDKKLFKTKKLKFMITCVGRYSKEGCHDCVIYKDTIDRMVLSLDKDEPHDIREYRNLYSLVLKHLVNSHEFKQEGKYFFVFISTGITIGALIGSLEYDNAILGTSIGLIIGSFIGLVLEYRAKMLGIQI